MLANELDFVIGVDTHRDAHALVVLAARSGGMVARVISAAQLVVSTPGVVPESVVPSGPPWRLELPSHQLQGGDPDEVAR